MRPKSTLVFAALFIYAICGEVIAQDQNAYEKNPNYIQQMGLYKVYKSIHANIVMLGNSITHGADWNELLGRNDVINRGITSDVLKGFLSRMQYVYRAKPKVCFIMGGINDIYNWRNLELMLEDYKKIVNGLKMKGIRPIIQSVLFVGRKWPGSDGRNKEVKKFNKLLVDYAKKSDIVFINLNKRMSSLNFLRSNLTYDGIHLNGKGFKIWAEEVEKVLAKLKI